MRISVVVVTWNGLRLLQPCVAALQAQTVEHELVVVDNGSHDGTVRWVKEALPTARLVALPTNLGFAGGNNAGLRAARGDLLVLVNNDTVPPPAFLADLTQPLEQGADIGAAAGVLTFAHRREWVASAGIAPSRDGAHRDARALTPVAALPQEPCEIFGASGGAVCYRRAALVDAGLFEDRFVNYLEDADLGWRLRLRHWRTVLAPAACIPHIYSATSGHFSANKQRSLALNRWRLLLRCWPSALLWSNLHAILRYDVLAIAYGLWSRQNAIVRGRLEALGELPLLLRERRRIARAATADSGQLQRWLEPAPSIADVLRERRALDQVLRDRPA